MGELIVYRSSRRASVLASVNTFKHEYLCNHLADWNEILSEASLGWGIGFSRFLAHLSRRLIGELIGYQWSGVRPSFVYPSSVVVVNNFKHLLLQNRLLDQSQILCGASLGRGNESLFAASGSHDQDRPPRPYMVKTLQKSSQEPAGGFSRNLVCSIQDFSPS